MRRTLPCCLVILAACGGSDRVPVNDAPGDPSLPVGTGPVAPGDRADAPATVHDGLRFTASTAVMESFPIQLTTTVDVANTGTDTAHLVFPHGCIVLLRAYRESDEPAWDQAGVTFCTMAIEQREIAPGRSATFSTRSDAREILGDSLPDGTYELRAYLTANGEQLELDAGTVPLAVPR
jgi:hypothetical protein